MARFPAIPADERTLSTDFIKAFDKPSLTRLHSWNGTMLLARSWVLMLLCLLTEYDTPYVLYAHAENALAAGLSREQIQQAVHGRVPGGLDEQERMVQLWRPMQDEEYDEAVGILGRERIAGLVHIASLYIYAVMLTNIGSDGDVPPTKEGSFIATKNPALGEWVSWGGCCIQIKLRA
ncbi:hypothetical protein ANOM_008698 [Aspergillus nomiae NRRL 13137]|uniref:Carboxymuconolactone decarboxylase-like domain-containing protein n=1 Tax=Aspergillus nomiae NRRL (strain ATCC 15546 / NRRL 13137 / CBS 260.88 / M93) TaxID=1509407 RepID=A0A0L1IS35_ASPN3|nr:uncharacterized protein ANOM_008698 [Aspergillus nomiae NRRL 13137]KNG82304.1 hypothetical protein ANOM_008698 [Aspergillus nomiae NRRL 13137]